MPIGLRPRQIRRGYRLRHRPVFNICRAILEECLLALLAMPRRELMLVASFLWSIVFALRSLFVINSPDRFRTCTPKNWYLKPARMPFPPQGQCNQCKVTPPGVEPGLLSEPHFESFLRTYPFVHLFNIFSFSNRYYSV